MRSTTSIALILMVLAGIVSAQNPAQMQGKIKSDAVLLQDQMAKADYLQERNVELERLLKVKQGEIDRLTQNCKPSASQAGAPSPDSTKVLLTRFRRKSK